MKIILNSGTGDFNHESLDKITNKLLEHNFTHSTWTGSIPSIEIDTTIAEFEKLSTLLIKTIIK